MRISCAPADLRDCIQPRDHAAQDPQRHHDLGHAYSSSERERVFFTKNACDDLAMAWYEVEDLALEAVRQPDDGNSQVDESS